MRRAALFVAITLASAASACAAILGIDDVALKDAGANDASFLDGYAIDASTARCVLCNNENDGSPCALACNVATPDAIGLANVNGGALVYWTTRGDPSSTSSKLDGGGLWQSPITAATPVLIENAFGDSPNDLSISNAPTLAYSLGNTNQIRLSNGNVDASALLLSTPDTPTTVRITLDSSVVFFLSGNPGDQKLYRSSVADAGAVLFAGDLTTSTDVSGVNVGWTTMNGDVLVSAFATGSTPTVIAIGQLDPDHLALTGDGTFAAWSVDSVGHFSIVTADVAKRVVSEPVWTGSSVGGMRFAPGARVLYVTDSEAGTVSKIDLESTPQTTVLASGQDHPSSIHLGNVWTVWTNRGSGNSTGSVMRRATN